MIVPDKTSAEAYLPYTKSKCLRPSRGKAWRDLKAWITEPLRETEALEMPGVSEAYLAWTFSGEAEFQEREGNSPWVTHRIKKGSFFLTTGGGPYECRWKALTPEPFLSMMTFVELPLLQRAMEEVFGAKASQVRLRDLSAFTDPDLSWMMEGVRQELMARRASVLRVQGLAQLSKGYNDSVTLEQRTQTLEQLSRQRWADAEKGAPAYGPGMNELKGGEPQFLVDYHDYYKTPRGFHPRAVNSNGSWSVTNPLSFMNMPILTYIAEISPRPVLFIHGEKAHSRYFSETAYAAAAEPKELLIIPGASHVDLYDRVDVIPFDRITAFAALNARNYLDSLERLARYKQLCGAQEFRFIQRSDEFQIEVSWPFAADEAPPSLLLDAMFALIMELGRRGTQTHLTPKRIELRRKEEAGSGLGDYFGCPIKYRSRRDALVLRAADSGLPFVIHNEELLEMLAPQLEDQLKAGETTQSIHGQVKWVLRRMLAGSRPDIALVAKELGMSARTLQRRITDEGSTFRDLLNETRREQVREHLANGTVEIAEISFLVGYDNPNSFYRAFRSWEGQTPAEWRAAHLRRSAG